MRPESSISQKNDSVLISAIKPQKKARNEPHQAEETFNDPFMATLNEWKDVKKMTGVDFSDSTKLKNPILDDTQTKLI